MGERIGPGRFRPPGFSARSGSDTTEYGLRLSTRDNRYSIKINWSETARRDDKLVPIQAAPSGNSFDGSIASLRYTQPTTFILSTGFEF